MDSVRLPGRGKGMKQPKLEYVGTFIKASGAARTMRFVTSPDKLRSGGHITVFDVEKRSLPKFNLATLVGRLTAFTPGTQPSFCA